jgi:hypothetical protein
LHRALVLLPLSSTHTISHRAAPHPVLRSIIHRACSSSLCVAPPMLRTVARPPRALRCCRRRCSPLEGRGRCQRHGCHDARPQQGDVVMNDICFECFQTFQRYVVIVSYGCLQKQIGGCCTCWICCKCFRSTLQIFQRFVQNVSSVQMYVASILIWMLHMFHTHVATICSKYFSLILQ